MTRVGRGDRDGVACGQNLVGLLGDTDPGLWVRSLDEVRELMGPLPPQIEGEDLVDLGVHVEEVVDRCKIDCPAADDANRADMVFGAMEGGAGQGG